MNKVQVPERKLSKGELIEQERKLEAHRQAQKNAKNASKVKGRWNLYKRYLAK